MTTGKADAENSIEYMPWRRWRTAPAQEKDSDAKLMEEGKGTLIEISGSEMARRLCMVYCPYAVRNGNAL